MEILKYSCTPELAAFAKKAAEQWNKVMSGLVSMQPLAGTNPPDIIISMGSVDRSKHASRIAECRRIPPPRDSGESCRWVIIFADDSKWALTWWQRLIGDGHNPLAAMLHEMGHIFALPHAANPEWVMHPEIPDVTKISAREGRFYRQMFEPDGHD